MKFKKLLEFIFSRRHFIYFHFPSETLKFIPFSEIFLSLFTADEEDAEHFKSAIKGLYPRLQEVMLFNSGRMAMYTYLRALDLEKGSKVVVPPFTCDVVINALLYLDLMPVYCDISAENFGYDIGELRKTVSEHRPRVIIAQHSFGIPCAIEEIMDIAEKNGIAVIEDCAHGFGVPYKGKRLGEFGHAAFFSTDQTKSFSTLLGGVLILNKMEEVDRVRQVYNAELVPFPRTQVLNIFLQQLYFKVFNHDRVYVISQFLQSMFYRWGLFFDLKEDGVTFKKPKSYPMGMSHLQAHWGHLQLQSLERNFSERMTSVVDIENVLGIKKFRGLPLLRYPLLVPDRQNYRFESKYFEIGNWFDCVALNRVGSDKEIYYRAGTCPVAERIHGQIINIPLLPSDRELYRRLLPELFSILNIK
ncbi:MAG: DegT/DnrJ/EryC1/StrS family aminotransferase [Bdellovibrionota bacterium]